MLHEVLLALYGHPSPLFDHAGTHSFPLITPPESALLTSVGRLATLHRALRSHLSRISAHHSSLICRAVATSISSSQIAKFQALILDVEQQILSRNSSSVGAYDIVPLAGVVAKFEPWKRRFDWYWELACFMYPADATTLSNDSSVAPEQMCTGPAVLNKLRADSQTGYPDVEESALALLAVAERAWLRQLSTWLLNGTIPPNASQDFFIHQGDLESLTVPNHTVSEPLIPSFVTEDAAHSILFVGKTLGMLLSKSSARADSLPLSTTNPSLQSAGIVALDVANLRDFATLVSPISSAVFSSAVANLRSAVSSRVVDEVLPVHSLMRTLFLLRRFMLIGRGDFTDALIAEADDHLATRHQQARVAPSGNLADDLASVILKEGEVGTVLTKTWSALAPTISKEAAVDEEVEWAREHMSLSLTKEETRKSKPVIEGDGNAVEANLPPLAAAPFEELLFSTPTSLSLHLDSAFDLFLGKEERRTYSLIHSYLLGVRRAHNHLADAWRQTPLRRDHPAPIRRGRAKKAFQVLKEVRRKRAARMHALRPVWHTCNNAVITLAELGEYLAQEVVQSSWDAFRSWALQRHDDGGRPPSRDDAAWSSHELSASQSRLPRDPEVLAQGHRQFLIALVNALVLKNVSYTKALKSLFVHIDQLVAFIRRLESIQRELDLRDEGVVVNEKRNLDQEERDVQDQLSRSSQLVSDDVVRLMRILQEVSAEPNAWTSFRHAATGFEPYSSRTGIERLLVRLDFSMNEYDND